MIRSRYTLETKGLTAVKLLHFSLLVLALVTAASALSSSSVAAPKPRALDGTVGPGFTITFETPDGKLVRKLRAGTYTIHVRDLSPIHNFHLSGPGVNKVTSVPRAGTATWTVKLERGVYRYRCDPHRTIMHGSVIVS